MKILVGNYVTVMLRFVRSAHFVRSLINNGCAGVLLGFVESYTMTRCCGEHVGCFVRQFSSGAERRDVQRVDDSGEASCRHL